MPFFEQLFAIPQGRTEAEAEARDALPATQRRRERKLLIKDLL